MIYAFRPSPASVTALQKESRVGRDFVTRMDDPTSFPLCHSGRIVLEGEVSERLWPPAVRMSGTRMSLRSQRLRMEVDTPRLCASIPILTNMTSLNNFSSSELYCFEPLRSGVLEWMFHSIKSTTANRAVPAAPTDGKNSLWKRAPSDEFP